MRRGFVALLALVLASGVAALDWATEGFRIVTSDGAREIAVARQPRALPDLDLVDQDGVAFSLADYRGRPVLVDLIYTRCPTICGVLGDDFRHVLNSPATRDLPLVSISFDPAHDDLAARRLYGERYDAVAPRWRVAAPVERHILVSLLRVLGAVVIPDGQGGFIHNSAVYLIDRQGRLARILDPDAPLTAIVATAREAREAMR